ncbi:maleylpyruvate isomerase family mycothiol-dependent enzyme [Actinoplanes friuliensis]|uniref:Mycothiol-dependent maleylpyruvate isomerase metal-binding domain-containing protein n=1 Tax=Actinoplanes friuliensis DSM 7358 TaxID=1246995 RepID=U5W167_9ACTN|nr:maleylpyruvate isomerase family mycothiol-dependent enzyme [Actinoplanes friuliensis]AGZ41700.1 hypothetical protein AFR_17110 [Actinoplanes friuliensis DSM 7358]
MTTLADRTIDALRRRHDQLAAVVAALTPAQLVGPSGATQWIVADVLSHVGSGAEITLAGFRAAVDSTPAPDQGFNQGVWDRWNALSPEEQAPASITSDAALVDALEAVPADRRDGLRISMGFLPEPLPLAGYAGMRLNEAILHGWDVEVAVDPAATLDPESAQVLAEQLAGDLSFLLGFIGKPDTLGQPATVRIQGTPFSIVLDGSARLTADPAEPTATFEGSLEAAMRLLAGRLRERDTADVKVSGNVSLDDLQRAFPGY